VKTPERGSRPSHEADVTPTRTHDDDRIDAHRMRVIGRLARGVAHELGNPLAAIVVFSQLIRNDDRLPDDLRRDAELLVEAAEETRSLATAFLDLARERPPERHPTRVAGLVERVVALEAHRVSAAGITFDIDLPDDLPRVAIDRARMQQVLLALADAAIDAAAGAGLAFRASANGGRVLLNVVPAAPLGDELVVRSIVEAHGGTFKVGAAGFEVELPALDPMVRGATVQRENSRSARRSRSTVLVVDDEEAMRSLLARALDRQGHRVVVAASGAEAVAAAADTKAAITAVLCDRHLGATSGIDVCARILAARADLRGHVAMMSADIEDRALRDYAEANGIELLAKPFDIARVTALVRALTG